MRKIIILLNRIGKDKYMHFFCGYFITLLLTLIISTKWLIILSVVLISITKEIFDYYNNGRVELLDIIFTCMPLLMLLL